MWKIGFAFIDKDIAGKVDMPGLFGERDDQYGTECASIDGISLDDYNRAPIPWFRTDR